MNNVLGRGRHRTWVVVLVHSGVDECEARSVLTERPEAQRERGEERDRESMGAPGSKDQLGFWPAAHPCSTKGNTRSPSARVVHMLN